MGSGCDGAIREISASRRTWRATRNRVAVVVQLIAGEIEDRALGPSAREEGVPVEILVGLYARRSEQRREQRGRDGRTRATKGA